MLRARYPPLYTFFTTGIAGSITTFSSWMLYGYLSFANFGGYNRGGLYDVCLLRRSRLLRVDLIDDRWPGILHFHIPDIDRGASVRRTSIAHIALG